MGAGREPAEVHAGGCHMTGPRWRAVDRDEARRLLSSGIRACGYCQPDVQLHILDLAAAPPARSGRARAPAGEGAGRGRDGCVVAKGRVVCAAEGSMRLPPDDHPHRTERRGCGYCVIS
ncbi:DUF6233 domain-containing protein [Streptomyces glaucescens]